jgi:hypothetical protein
MHPTAYGLPLLNFSREPRFAYSQEKPPRRGFDPELLEELRRMNFHPKDPNLTHTKAGAVLLGL